MPIVKIVPMPGPQGPAGSNSQDIDGGRAGSIYTIDQEIDGGNASGYHNQETEGS